MRSSHTMPFSLCTSRSSTTVPTSRARCAGRAARSAALRTPSRTQPSRQRAADPPDLLHRPSRQHPPAQLDVVQVDDAAPDLLGRLGQAHWPPCSVSGSGQAPPASADPRTAEWPRGPGARSPRRPGRSAARADGRTSRRWSRPPPCRSAPASTALKRRFRSA